MGITRPTGLDFPQWFTPLLGPFLPPAPSQDFSGKKGYHQAAGEIQPLINLWKKEVCHESVPGQEVFSGLPQDELEKKTRSGTTNTF